MLLGNPGGVGQPRDGDARASYAILEPFAEPEFQIYRIVYDVGAAARRIIAAGLPKLLADRLHLGV
jgi:diadenosine tetraphosphatase ApaH/serine/threonine PP2A family protein phosphatase